MTDGALPPPRDAPIEPDPMLGRTLASRYRIDALVARGGMSRVYRAHDERLDRDVAVKVLAPPYSDDASFSDRFLGEARAAASLSHPSLVHVYDSGSDGQAHYIVMELLEGHRTLRQVLADRGPLRADEVVRIGRELLAGLTVVHERGLVHCDVKAANVMLGPGPAKLIDFGIARSPRDGIEEGDTSIGTLQSMSPEQLHGEALTPASDLFSLATALYEALTGRVPYPGTTPEEVSAAHARAEVPLPSDLVAGVPARLDAVLLQALRRDPQSRFHSASAMARALEAAAEADRDPAEDETRVVAATPVERPKHAPPGGGYVPPPLPDRPASRPVRRRAPAPARTVPWNAVGSLLVLGAAALVVVLVVLPLLDLGATGGPAPSASPTASSAAPTVRPDVVPDTVGLSTAEAIDLATAAGLDWTVRCQQNADQPEGIIDQEPPAGTEVAPGSQFTMFSARIQDCR
jgi:serine/threonine-protein kinase